MNTPSVPSRDEARWALVEAGAAREMLASKSRWPRRYLLIYAIGAAITFVAVGLGGTIGIIVVASAWPLTVVLMQRSSRRRSVTELGGRRLIAVGAISWGVLYICGLTVGTVTFRDNPWYWVPASIVVALPFLALAIKGRKL